MILPILFLVLAISLAAPEVKLEITKLTRDIYLKGKYVRISYDIELQSNGPVTTKKYLHLIHPNFSNNLIDVLAFTKDFTELSLTKDSPSSFTVDLPTALQVGKKTSIKILELYKNRMAPKPPRLSLSSDEQKVEFVDNLYVYSAYSVRSQETLVTVPNIKKVEYYTEREAAVNEKTKTIKYGPLYGAYMEEELRIHYELPVPLIYFPSVAKQIELSHLGSISIKEQYELKNNAAELDGEFSRVKYNALTGYQQAGHILRKLYTQLPRKAFGLYYRDVVGNVSTSVATRQSSYVFFEIRPRFPVFGGWQTKWEQGYNLLNQFYIKYDTQDPNLYIFNQTFGYAFKKIVADKYKLSVILPPGAHDVKVYLPFKADVKEEVQRSYLDVEGRKVIVIEKENMHSYYAKNFLVTYRLTPGGMYEKLILMIVFFMVFYGAIISCSRVNLKLD